MSDGNIDDLIEELYPSKGKTNPPLHSTAGVSQPLHTRRQSEWDDDDDDDDGGGVHGRNTAGATRTAQVNRNRSGPVLPSAGHSFDDSSSSSSSSEVKHNNAVANARMTNGSSGASDPTSHNISGDVSTPPHGSSNVTLHRVPFPSLSTSEGAFSCAPRCYLTNIGAVFRGGEGHPTLPQLRELAVGERSIVGGDYAKAMRKKGAFHAVREILGNGCLDNRGDGTSDGGCPHILCQKCNYMVVRLQGAEWDDDEGRFNLYLTLRNYYPDWCQLANSTPVGAEESSCGANRLVLKVNPTAAAYCCQCSWLTVKSAKAVVVTRLSDAFLTHAGADGTHPFATVLPLESGEKRRPPLWVCHGHP